MKSRILDDRYSCKVIWVFVEVNHEVSWTVKENESHAGDVAANESKVAPKHCLIENDGLFYKIELFIKSNDSFFDLNEEHH